MLNKGVSAGESEQYFSEIDALAISLSRHALFFSGLDGRFQLQDGRGRRRGNGTYNLEQWRS